MPASVPDPRIVTPGGNRSPISKAQIEGLLSRLVAVFGVVFAVQTLPVISEQVGAADPLWGWTVVPVLYASIVVLFVAAMLQRWVTQANVLVCVLFFIVLVSWPFAIIDVEHLGEERYWLYFLISVATSTAAIGLSTPTATVYLFVVPFTYGAVRLTAPGGGATVLQSLLESTYALLVGGAILLFTVLLRQAAVSVDVAQAAALDRYSLAVHAHATEVERVQVDSIVHDSVLTTLLSAARAYTPESKALAARMAGNAIGHLREAALVNPDDGSTVRLSSVQRRISEAAASMSAPFEQRIRGVSAHSMPLQAAEAVYSAAVQAMVNSLQHAGQDAGLTRWLTIRGVQPAGIEVEVGDTGVGFSFVDLPAERMGLRVSIVERVTNAGGAVEIDSAINEGTAISIRWPRPDATRRPSSVARVLPVLGEEEPS
jgi:signal transduction histidine kinase